MTITTLTRRFLRTASPRVATTSLFLMAAACSGSVNVGDDGTGDAMGGGGAGNLDDTPDSGDGQAGFGGDGNLDDPPDSGDGQAGFGGDGNLDDPPDSGGVGVAGMGGLPSGGAGGLPSGGAGGLPSGGAGGTGGLPGSGATAFTVKNTVVAETSVAAGDDATVEETSWYSTQTGNVGPSEASLAFTAAQCLASAGPASQVRAEANVGAFVEGDWLTGAWLNWDETGSNDQKDQNACGEAASTVTVTGSITQDATWSKDAIHVLTDIIYVEDGATLTLDPCTKVVGEQGSGLIVARGGKVDAVGTANEPIVFTSAKAPGSRGPGDWGGLALLGKASAIDGSDRQLEGVDVDPRSAYGGSTDDDGSGSLAYVRIEFAGQDVLSFSNEWNGLTLAGVGSATDVHHVMVHRTLDDCFEWLGGAGTAHHLVCNDAGDDLFDVDQGFRGSLSELFGRQGEPLSSDPRGLEADGTETFSAATVNTDVVISNATLCGVQDDDAATGVLLREGIVGELKSSIIVGFKAGAFDVR